MDAGWLKCRSLAIGIGAAAALVPVQAGAVTVVGGIVYTLNILGSIASVAAGASALFDLATGNECTAGVDCSGDTLSIRAGETFFNMTITGDGFALDDVKNYSGKVTADVTTDGNTSTAGLWEFTINITEDAGFFNDEITANGTLTHLWNPHTDIPKPDTNAETYQWGFKANADDAVNGSVKLKGFERKTHFATHADNSRYSFNGTVSTFGSDDDYTAYSLVVASQHVPLPSSLPLAALGCAAMRAVARRRRIC